MKKIIYTILASLIFFACSDELDEAPSKSTNVEISELEHLYALLDNNVSGISDNMISDYFTDDFGLLTDIYDRDNYAYKSKALFATWNTEAISQLNDGPWSNSWKFIYVLNTISENISNVDATNEQQENLKAEVALLRSVIYLNLVSDYCLAYSQSTKSSLGLPKKLSTAYTESMERMSIEETMNFIQEGFEIAVDSELPNHPKLANGRSANWRASKLIAHTYYARFYLMKHEYVKAKEQVEKALAIENKLRNFNTNVSTYSDPWSQYQVVENGVTKTVSLEYSSDYNSSPSLGNHLIYGSSRTAWGNWLIPSQSLLDTYQSDEDDLRYKYYIVDNFSYSRSGFQNPAYKWSGYVRSFNGTPTGASVGELYCMKAECQARLGEWQDALVTINTLRSHRISETATAKINLVAASQDEAIQKILEERRRELPFVVRWFDIKRYNANDYDQDDVTVSRRFYEVKTNGVNAALLKDYTLSPNSLKTAIPIPDTDILNSKGQLEQNKY